MAGVTYRQSSVKRQGSSRWRRTLLALVVLQLVALVPAASSPPALATALPGLDLLASRLAIAAPGELPSRSWLDPAAARAAGDDGPATAEWVTALPPVPSGKAVTLRSGQVALDPFLDSLGVDAAAPRVAAAPSDFGSFVWPHFTTFDDTNLYGYSLMQNGGINGLGDNQGAIRVAGTQSFFNPTSPSHFGVYGDLVASTHALMLNAGLAQLNAMSGNGNWNQFLGQMPAPGGWGASVQGHDPFYAGAGFGSFDLPPTILAVLGYNPSSPYSFGTQMMQNLNNIYTPWTGGGFGLFSAQASGELAQLQAPPGSLEQRYNAVGQLQLDTYYTDQGLSNLRSESNAVLIYAAYTDPYYVYWSYEQGAVLQHIAASRPSYGALAQLSQEIAGWTTPATDQATLAQRYSKRLLLMYLLAEVEYESALFLAANPHIAAWIDQVNALLAQRLELAWSRADVLAWYAGWQTRWAGAYAAAPGYQRQVAAMSELFADYPPFQEYLQLNAEVVDLLKVFEGNPQARQTYQLMESILSADETTQAVTASYGQYRDQLNRLINTTAFTGEIEQFYGLLNGMLSNDSTYNLLATVQYLVVINFNAYLQQMHDAVANCYRSFGAACNPYADPNVAGLIGSTATWELIANVGQFFELYNQYWHAFYDTPGYQQLEATFSTRLAAALAPIQGEVEAIRAEFRANVQSMPSVKTLNASWAALGQYLRGGASGAGVAAHVELTAEEAQASSAINDRLNRMAALAAQLESPSGRVFLPALSR